MPREVPEQFGTTVDDARFGGAYYFHGTRVRDPGSFLRQGILPLDQMVEQIWSMLYEFVCEERTQKQWAEFRKAIETDACGHDGDLYRLKTRDRLHLGPTVNLCARKSG
jgi:hypothetical protein